MKKRAHLAWIGGFLGAFALSVPAAPAALGGNPKTQANTSHSYRIGALWFSFTIPAVQAVIRGEHEEAKRLGVQTIDLDGQGDPQIQAQQAANLLIQHVDAVIINPIDPVSIVPYVKKFYQAGIPVIAEEMNVAPSGRKYITTFVGPDDVQVGRLCAQLMKKALGPGGGNVVVIEGAAGASSTLKRLQGFQEGIKGTKIKILAMQTTNWDRKKAMTAMQDFLTKYPDIDGVFGEDDDVALGAIQAIKAAGRAGKIKVIGHDGSKEAVDAIKRGEMYGTVSQPLVQDGITDVKAAVAALQGKKVPAWYKDRMIMLTKRNLKGYVPPF